MKKSEHGETKASEAWEVLLNKYNIKEHIEKNGIYHITAAQIKEVAEPRLMAKWDSKQQLPSSLKKNKINILPNSRSSYVLGDFLLYKELPELTEHINDMLSVELPDLETVDSDNITSEANAINVLQLSGILEDFLELEYGDTLYSTFNGRMSSGNFIFNVDTERAIPQVVEVNKAQVEIDGGFESEEFVVILEAKNVLHEDFHIRQLYYPYRLWESKVKKPIRLIFSIYTNKVFRLMEYRFREKNNYSSIELVKLKNYSLEDTTITIEDIKEVHKNIIPSKIMSDDKNTATVPFVQANNFERIISLLEHMYESEMTGEEIERLMKFTSRQRDYYYNAGKFLGLFTKYKDDDKCIKYTLTSFGRRVYKNNYKKRQLLLVEAILSHKIFEELFKRTIISGEIPSKKEIENLEIEYNVCSAHVAARRSGTVTSWLKWIFNLTTL